MTTKNLFICSLFIGSSLLQTNLHSGGTFIGSTMSGELLNLTTSEVLLVEDSTMREVDFTGIIQCAEVGTIVAQEPFDKTMFTKACRGEFNVSIYDLVPLLVLATLNDDLATVVELLNAKEIDLEARTYRKQTALMLAAEHGNKEIVIALLNAGADVLEEDDDYNTALYYAHRNGHYEIEKILESRIPEVAKSTSDQTVDNAEEATPSETIEEPVSTPNETVEEQISDESDVVTEEEAVVVSGEGVVLDDEEVVSGEEVVLGEDVILDDEVVVSGEGVVLGEEVVLDDEEVVLGEEVVLDDEVVVSGEGVVLGEDVVLDDEEVVLGEEVVLDDDEVVSGEEVVPDDEEVEATPTPQETGFFANLMGSILSWFFG